MRSAGHVQRISEDRLSKRGKQKRVAEEEDQSCDGKTIKRDLERAGTNGQEQKTEGES